MAPPPSTSRACRTRIKVTCRTIRVGCRSRTHGLPLSSERAAPRLTRAPHAGNLLSHSRAWNRKKLRKISKESSGRTTRSLLMAVSNIRLIMLTRGVAKLQRNFHCPCLNRLETEIKAKIALLLVTVCLIRVPIIRSAARIRASRWTISSHGNYTSVSAAIHHSLRTRT